MAKPLLDRDDLAGPRYSEERLVKLLRETSIRYQHKSAVRDALLDEGKKDTERLSSASDALESQEGLHFGVKLAAAASLAVGGAGLIATSVGHDYRPDLFTDNTAPFFAMAAVSGAATVYAFDSHAKIVKARTAFALGANDATESAKKAAANLGLDTFEADWRAVAEALAEKMEDRALYVITPESPLPDVQRFTEAVLNRELAAPGLEPGQTL